MAINFEQATIEAHSLLQISPKNRDQEWEEDRQEWLDKWEPVLVDEADELIIDFNCPCGWRHLDVRIGYKCHNCGRKLIGYSGPGQFHFMKTAVK